MLEMLVAATGLELGKVVLEQVLDFGQTTLEGYVEDFFADCLDKGVARLKASTLKKSMAQAIGFFMQQFVKELEFNDVPDSSIQHHYKSAIKQFVQDKTVRPILGKAFETGCKKIDAAQLKAIWTEQYQQSGYRFPGEFDWRGIAKAYVVEVKGIVKADAELRAILDTELLEAIAQNTTQLSPGFDVATYRESLQASYGYLKLYTLDSTDRTDNIKLWSMFIEQTVREALPPMRYELPLDLKRQLQEQGQLDDLSAEALEHYRQEYFQQPARKVLEAVAEVQRAVILGDPGAGKSTLLQYLALDWVEGKTETLPLLIELREYVLAQSANFLEFLHCGRGVDWQFDQQHLHQHLLENPTLVMFDGLDEVFDRPTQSAVVDDIIRFAQQYPQAKVIVTSRIIGYTPERFQHAGFRQFTIQNLDETEIHEFIDRWYDLAMGSDADKVRLKQRLKDAISNSKAIANLADNPLLLTMMAILNRRQELPRDRADLYDQASRVLLYHWDVDHKRLQLPMDAIGRREKQEMLRLIAYEMQTGEEGLKGNLISADRLIRVLTDYLRNQGFSDPREKASLLIQQLRERNFILCYRGADTYGFMHRTFLEYFCAIEIVHRFEKKRTLTFEQLRDEVFGRHWQDETWHEVLRLICGMIDEKLVGEMIENLGEKGFNYFASLGLQEMESDGVLNCLLACNCLKEVRNTSSIRKSIDIFLETIKSQINYINFDPEVIESYFECIIANSKNKDDTLIWLQKQIQNNTSWSARWGSIWALSKHYRDDSKTLSLVHACLKNDENEYVRAAALQCLACYYHSDIKTLDFLKYFAQEDSHSYVRTIAIEMLEKYDENPETLTLFYERIQLDQNSNVRQATIIAFVEAHYDGTMILNFLKRLAQIDEDSNIR